MMKEEDSKCMEWKQGFLSLGPVIIQLSIY